MGSILLHVARHRHDVDWLATCMLGMGTLLQKQREADLLLLYNFLPPDDRAFCHQISQHTGVYCLGDW